MPDKRKAAVVLPGMMRAVAYARYSTAQQQETSIIGQLRAITEYCVSNNIELVDSFVDEAQSGTNVNRDHFQDLLAAASRHEFDAVVVYDITRGSRDVVDWFTFRKSMHKLGIKVLSVTEKLGDLLDPNAFITEGVTVMIGHHKVLQDRQKSIEFKRIRAEKAMFCGGYAPLGYDIKRIVTRRGQKDVVDSYYVINVREAAGVRLAFEWYAAGRSYLEITEKLKSMGITGRRGRFIGTNTLYFILRNERYTGKFIMYQYTMRVMHEWVGKKNDDPLIIPDAIPRIISDELWERVQMRVKDNIKNKTNHSKQKREYVLTGLFHCAHCGGAYTGMTTTSKGHEYKLYVCANKKRLHNCQAKNIKADLLEPAIFAVIKDKLLNSDMIEKTADAIIQTLSSQKSESSEDLRREIAAIDVKIGNLLHTLETGFDSQPVRDRIGELTAQRQILSDRLKDSAHTVEFSRDALIALLQEDSQLLREDDSCIKELLKKYIVRIDIGDEEIVVHAIADIAKKGAQPSLRVVPTIGSPGRTRTYNPSVNRNLSEQFEGHFLVVMHRQPRTNK